jgi:uncharacterized protein (TIGR03663 family)
MLRRLSLDWRPRRLHWRPTRPDPVTLVVLAIVGVGLITRVVDLGVRAMHHDESLHATFSWYFAEGRGYTHNPLMHGPFLFHVTAASFKLFGDSEVTARLPMALAGVAVIATPLLLRRTLGGLGTVAVATFLLVSPSLLYFSRFARNDIFMALWTVLIVAAIWRYREDGRLRWLLVVAAALALSFTTKETTYLTVAVLLVYLEVALASELITQHSLVHGRLEGWRRVIAWAVLLPGAWLVAALWRPLARLRLRLAFFARPRDADLIIVIGTLTVPQLAAAVQAPLTAAGVDVSGDTERWIGAAALSLLFVGSAAIGLLWRWRAWLLVMALFLLITVPLFTSFFTNLNGVGTGFWGSLDYWLAQQDVQRGNQPPFYYLMMLPIYELMVLAGALAGGLWLVWRGDGLAKLLLWWFAGTLFALSIAAEKMPWLTVHLALPLALLAGHALGAAVPAALRALSTASTASLRPIAGGAAAGGVLAAGLLLFALTLRTGVDVTYRHGDTPVEPLIYTQTTPEVPRLAVDIERAVTGDEGAPSVVIDTSSSLSWPWAWYLRDLRVLYAEPETLRAGNFEEGAVLIVATSTLATTDPLRDRYEPAVRYRHRWWFDERGYRAVSAGGMLRDAADGSLFTDWFDFFASRVDESTIGSVDGEVLLPR